MVKVKLIGLNGCPYSLNASKILKSHYKDIDSIWVNRGSDEYYDYKKIYSTFPQIFIGKKHIGGYDNLVNLVYK